MPCSKIPSALTRKDLSEAIYKALSTISRRDAGRIVDETFDEMIEALVRNEPVKLRGFGVFKIQHKNERIGRNPKTGIDTVISSRRSIKFSASPHVRAMVKGETPPNGSDDDESRMR
jgi:integration host factor subunit alpha